MANRKNNISDNEVKSAAGGAVGTYGTRSSGEHGYTVVDDYEKGKIIKQFEGFDEAARAKADLYNEAYHNGQIKGQIRGQQMGFKQGFDAAKSVVDDGGQL